MTLNGAPIAVRLVGRDRCAGHRPFGRPQFLPDGPVHQADGEQELYCRPARRRCSGNVDLRSARPFDRSGPFLAYNIQGSNQTPDARIGARGSLIGSWRNDTFGILGGVSAQRLFTETRGFETIGYTNPALTAAQCGATSGCNSTGGGNWTIPADGAGRRPVRASFPAR